MIDRNVFGCPPPMSKQVPDVEKPPERGNEGLSGAIAVRPLFAKDLPTRAVPVGIRPLILIPRERCLMPRKAHAPLR